MYDTIIVYQISRLYWLRSCRSFLKYLSFPGGGGHLAAMAAANMDGSGGLVLGLGNGGKQIHFMTLKIKS